MDTWHIRWNRLGRHGFEHGATDADSGCHDPTRSAKGVMLVLQQHI